MWSKLNLNTTQEKLKRMKYYINLLSETYKIQLFQGTAVTDIV